SLVSSRRLLAAARRLAHALAQGLHALAASVRAGVPRVWRGLTSGSLKLSDAAVLVCSAIGRGMAAAGGWGARRLAPAGVWSARALAPLSDALRSSSLALPLAVAGGAALVAGAGGIVARGLRGDGGIALLVGAAIFLILALARYGDALAP